LVDNRTTKKTYFRAGARNTTVRPGQRTNQASGPNANANRGFNNRNVPNANRKKYNWKDYNTKRIRDASIQIGSDWKVLEEIDINKLGKLNFPGVSEPKELNSYGFVNYYDRKFDRPTKSTGKLTQIELNKYNVTTSEDPVMQQLSKEDAGTVYITDAILSLLFCAPRSVYPWDIVINRVGDHVFFDKRDGGPLDFISVNENSIDPPSESDKDQINNVSALSEEATLINQYFASQVLDRSAKYDFANPNPFEDSADNESEPLMSCGYKYRSYELEEDFNVVVRGEVDAAFKKPNGETGFMKLCALNEFDSKSQGGLDWRQKLESSRGAVVATEMKNNNCKLARWAIQGVLGGAEQLKLGWVSRTKPKDNTNHELLATQVYKPKDFLTQLNFKFTNGWAILRALSLISLKLDEGKYILVKDPNTAIIRLYSLPQGLLDNVEQANDDSENVKDGQTA
jgi:translation initiation factor 3 subunit D